MMSIVRLMVTGVVAAVPMLTAAPVPAQAYPAKPVRLVIPFPPGGASDILARTIAERLSDAFRQPFVVENRAGAGGLIAIELVAKSPADGHALLSTPEEFSAYMRAEGAKWAKVIRDSGTLPAD